MSSSGMHSSRVQSVDCRSFGSSSFEAGESLLDTENVLDELLGEIIDKSFNTL